MAHPPRRVAHRGSVRQYGLLRRKLDGTNRQFCYAPGALRIARVLFIAQPPGSVEQGCHMADLLVFTGGALAGRLEPVVYYSPDEIFIFGRGRARRVAQYGQRGPRRFF
eukprot:15241568-Alexandrium_andersonii.AAC.1